MSEEKEQPIIVSRCRYLGSSLLPSPVESDVTIVLYPDRMIIPEADANIPIGKISQVELAKGKDLPSEAIMMFGVVGLIVEKENPYMMIRTANNPDRLIFRFENMLVAESLLKEIKAVSI
ncbi:MAG: hypothetical protein M3270_11880 [Thermoproteota archaeon]|nr:hypothetical protein [Thermoproteota archaeon]